jgi:hypothetical protein
MPIQYEKPSTNGCFMIKRKFIYDFSSSALLYIGRRKKCRDLAGSLHPTGCRSEQTEAQKKLDGRTLRFSANFFV